jgi:hypothetical protein
VEKSGSAFEAMFDTTVQYSISPEVTREAEVVAVICPLVSEEMSDSEQALKPLPSMWRTPRNYSGSLQRQHLADGAMTKA